MAFHAYSDVSLSSLSLLLSFVGELLLAGAADEAAGVLAVAGSVDDEEELVGGGDVGMTPLADADVFVPLLH